MLPVNGARSDVYEGSSGSTSGPQVSHICQAKGSHRPPTITKKVIVKDGMIVVIWVIRQAAGHYWGSIMRLP